MNATSSTAPVPFTSTDLPADRLRLVWSDEFDELAGTPPDPAKWECEQGGGGWGNGELEFYTDSTENAAQDGQSCLVITAKAVPETEQHQRTCWYGPARFTSARLLTRGRFAFTYGLVEARIKLPYGQGLWPAFWMLGENFGEVGWPACGEIDIMENIGREPGTVHGTVHGPGYCGGEGIGTGLALADGAMVRDDFHVFAVDWQPDRIRWYMDNRMFFELSREQIPQGAPWAFDHPFFLLMNVAVGGYWPGNPDETTVFPQTMTIDFVRVYQAG
ncbi:MAG: glycoside hydrolase family 16 protein [Desulfobulbus sp.]|jgi:beta-glucanase (GH16 family)|uniref:glycoside hydrolase family 16 protein n=1 Tax=Desulfobulbus sp. TaxID=895 RepID=UPI0028464AA0|nr:glycoside hydrolase family 16 protein [Desulfobulbus sp.]MDR2550265.1 glycoside hydrolase family 16 protein [Desulfobulbus sp.]